MLIKIPAAEILRLIGVDTPVRIAVLALRRSSNG